MTYIAIAEFILKYGPNAVSLAKQLASDVANRGNAVPTEAEWIELERLAGLTSQAIYANQGVTLPSR